jgi:hypothetical protein
MSDGLSISRALLLRDGEGIVPRSMKIHCIQDKKRISKHIHEDRQSTENLILRIRAFKAHR